MMGFRIGKGTAITRFREGWENTSSAIHRDAYVQQLKCTHAVIYDMNDLWKYERDSIEKRLRRPFNQRLHFNLPHSAWPWKYIEVSVGDVLVLR